MGAARFRGGGGYGLLPKYTCIFFSLEEDNDLESKDEIDSDSTDLTDDDSDEATDTAVDTDDADTEDSGKKIFRMHRVILLLPFYFPFAPYRELQDSLLLGFRIPSRGFRIPAKYRSLSAELGFHSLLEFRISKAAFWSPKPCIPDFTSKNFQDSGIQIPVHGAISFLSLNHGELLNFWKKHFSISLLGC